MHILLSSGGAYNTRSVARLDSQSRFLDPISFSIFLGQHLTWQFHFNCLMSKYERYLWTRVTKMTSTQCLLSWPTSSATSCEGQNSLWRWVYVLDINDIPTRLRLTQLKMLRHLLLLLLKLFKLVVKLVKLLVKLVVRRKVRRIMLCATPLLLLFVLAPFFSKQSPKQEKKALSHRISRWA